MLVCFLIWPMLSLFTPHQVWCWAVWADSAHTNQGVQWKAKMRSTALRSDLNHLSSECYTAPKGERKAVKMKRARSEVPCGSDLLIISMILVDFVQSYYFFSGRDCWTSIWQHPMAALLLLSVWVTHLALQRASAGIEKNRDVGAWSCIELWVSMLLCLCSNLTTELCSSNQRLEQFGGRSECCLCSSGECQRNLSMKQLNRKRLYYSHIEVIFLDERGLFMYILALALTTGHMGKNANTHAYSMGNANCMCLALPLI